ncbi:hypothetical protein [Pseudogemmobacter sonorensis]|uniref:hypothetical protein n=1 Tax=Pseudogemmobacter sonorensis TaxID=2989681 RepID=UPI0036C168E0
MRLSPRRRRHIGSLAALALSAAAFAALSALSARAETTLTAEEFDAYVTGKTLTYTQYGEVFGIEEYLPGRKVRWKATFDTCQYGSWFAREDLICFVYEYSSTEHCWQFWRSDSGLSALSVNDAPGSELSEVAQTADGLDCPAPDVGV